MESERRDDTHHLVEQAQQGDRRALEVLFARYREHLLPLVRARLGAKLRAHVDSQDILDSVLGDAYLGLGRFECRTEGAFLHWLSKIAANKIHQKADHFYALKRGGGRAPAGGSVGAGMLAGRAGAGPTPSQAAEAREARERLYQALDELDEDQREVLLLVRLQGLPRKEVAQILGCSENAVSMRVARALEALTRIYARRGEAPG